jgi:phospholipid/cholesterol/gamma-HCH transport system permease protein
MSLAPQPEPTFLVRIGRSANGLFMHVGVLSQMAIGTVRQGFKRPLEGKAIVQQLESLGVASLGIVVVTSVFIGMVMATQFAFGLRKFGGMEYTGRVVGLSFARELAPTLTAVIVGGRIGSGMAAEVGSMNVTEQVDAVRALGADPAKKLVLPRVVAAIIVMPVLSLVALSLGVLGALIVCAGEYGIAPNFFMRTSLETVRMSDLWSGLLKTPFFGYIIAIVGCHYGLGTTGGTEGVGRSTTKTVVAVSISILIADFLLTKILVAFLPG